MSAEVLLVNKWSRVGGGVEERLARENLACRKNLFRLVWHTCLRDLEGMLSICPSTCEGVSPENIRDYTSKDTLQMEGLSLLSFCFPKVCTEKFVTILHWDY